MSTTAAVTTTDVAIAPATASGAAAIVGSAIVAAAIIGSRVNTLPPSCSALIAVGITCQQCGGS